VDAEFRSIARRASSTGAPDDSVALLKAMLRAGFVSRRQAEVAAALGHEIARRVVRDTVAVDPWETGLRLLSDTSLRFLACDFAERVVPVLEGDSRGAIQARAVLEVSRRFADAEATRAELHAAQRTALAVALVVAGTGAREAMCTIALTAAPGTGVSGHMFMTAFCVANGVLRVRREVTWEAKPPYQARDAAAIEERRWQRRRLASSLVVLRTSGSSPH
jgi:hypothetical protein